MTQLRRVMSRGAPRDVLGRIQDGLELALIEAPTLDGQPLILWFSPPGEPTVLGLVSDPVVEMQYLVVDRAWSGSAGAELLESLDLVAADEILARSIDDPWDAADVAVQLGIVADVPWSDAVESMITALEGHEEIGVEASARLARQYREALEQASAPGPDPSSN